VTGSGPIYCGTYTVPAIAAVSTSKGTVMGILLALVQIPEYVRNVCGGACPLVGFVILNTRE